MMWKVLLLGVLMALSVAAVAAAPVEHVRYGKLDLHTGPAPAGLEVEMYVEGTLCATSETKIGWYSATVPAASVAQPGCGSKDRQVSLQINGVVVSEFFWSTGKPVRRDIVLDEAASFGVLGYYDLVHVIR